MFCSVISSSFVQKKYLGILAGDIVEMIPNQPKTVLVTGSQEEYHLRVTALQSNHCPGSLMFIMERLDTNGAVHKRILYTGDFRFDNPDLPLTCLRSLHSGTTPLHIDEMYLDTTFCSNKYLTFPTRQEAEEKIWSICEEVDQEEHNIQGEL